MTFTRVIKQQAANYTSEKKGSARSCATGIPRTQDDSTIHQRHRVHRRTSRVEDKFSLRTSALTSLPVPPNTFGVRSRYYTGKPREPRVCLAETEPLVTNLLPFRGRLYGYFRQGFHRGMPKMLVR